MFSCTLVRRESLHANDVEAMAAGDWDLSLFACTTLPPVYPGIRT